ncbi:hypothetical protein HHI36_009424 [Cryptolaemus montrouzieri]|uniref:Uncharacterized protein n=1 Tax=Cryptolaemus montrouzieri TaxID=559131 RepID=A0ABD2MW47_9CUCU
MAPNDELNNVCNYCKNPVINFVSCKICEINKYHVSSAKRVCEMNKKTAKCPNCRESEVKEDKTAFKNAKDPVRSTETLQDTNQIPQITDLIKVIIDLKASVQFMSDIFDQLANENKTMLTELKCLREENATLRTNIVHLEADFTKITTFLETKLNDMKQRDRKNNLVITGLPKQTNDDGRIIVKNIMLKLLECNIRRKIFMKFILIISIVK